MSAVAIQQRNKIHPHKFTLWLGIGSILMMFAGLTSAYIVKRNQANWAPFDLPLAFYYSTAVILASSATMWLAEKSFKARLMPCYRLLLAVTLVLGIIFTVLQVWGFSQLVQIGVTLKGNVSWSFLYVIVGLHALHILGGIIALIVMSLKAFSSRERSYSLVPVELMSTYWHFVDVLWIYLLLFLWMIR